MPAERGKLIWGWNTLVPAPPIPPEALLHDDYRLAAPLALDAPRPAEHYAIVHLCTCCTRSPEYRQFSRSTSVPASPFRPHLRSSPAVCVFHPNSIRGRV